MGGVHRCVLGRSQSGSKYHTKAAAGPQVTQAIREGGGGPVSS